MSNRIKSIKTVKNPNYQIDGFTTIDSFKEKDINKVIIDFYNHLKLQAFKLGLIKTFNANKYDDIIKSSEIDKLIKKVNAANKKSIDYVVQTLRECPSIFNLVNKNFLSNSSKILRCPESILKIHFDGILINIPSNKSRLYRFHSESHYYPKRKNFFNLWMPIIRDKTNDNGVMEIKHKGHKKNYSFNEFSGFDKVVGFDLNENDFKHQLEIPEDELNDSTSLLANLKKNECLIFHQNLPHRSTINKSNQVSYALIARVYDFRKDTTLSDKNGVKPYTLNASNSGYPNLKTI